MKKLTREQLEALTELKDIADAYERLEMTADEAMARIPKLLGKLPESER